ncbi:MAG: sarcosine oxidase subunit delta [Pseudomonadota bacterium]
MRIPCPICGDRDCREFTPKGHRVYLDRPEDTAWSEGWNNYLHLRENPAGVTEELWFHGQGCGAWLIVERNTVTHEVIGARLAAESKT